MKVYKISIFVSLITTLISLFFVFLSYDTTMNILISVFASSILIFVTSVISYIAYEEKESVAFYWNLVELVNKLHELSTIPNTNFKYHTQLEKITALNCVIRIHFALYDYNDYIQAIFLKNRQDRLLIQDEVTNLVSNLYYRSCSAEFIYRSELRLQHRDDSEIFSTLMQNEVIDDFFKFIDNYQGNGPFVCYINDNYVEKFRKLLKKT